MFSMARVSMLHWLNVDCLRSVISAVKYVNVSD
jgi:hypothetical protein